MLQSDILLRLTSLDSPAVVAWIVSVSGSAPRHEGTAMLIPQTGESLGTVGGGIVEARALEKARECFAHSASSMAEVFLEGEEAKGSEGICGGKVCLMLDYIEPGGLYSLAAASFDAGSGAILVLKPDGIEPGAIAALDATGSVLARRGQASVPGSGFVPESGAAAKALSSPSGFYKSPSGLLYAAVAFPDSLLILGGGYVGSALAWLAPRLGFKVTVADFRPEFASPGRFPPEVRCRLGDFSGAIEEFPFDARTSYVVVVSPGHAQDLECLRSILVREYRYAGFIGSKRKARLLLESLIAEGFPRHKVLSLRGPIGADIGAETPEEIAVSILAEMIAVRRGSPAADAMDADRSRRRGL
ncbi:MAG TPA: XdhC family protein [Rectinemataceae bacterium]